MSLKKQRTYLVLVLLMLTVVSSYAGDKVKERKEIDDVFALDINNLNSPAVIKTLTAKKCKYRGLSILEEPVDEKNPDEIITTCFLGSYLDYNKIIRVGYCFPPIGSEGNGGEGEVRGEYHDALLKKLCGIYGPFKVETGEDGARYCNWKTEDRNRYIFSDISLCEESLYELGGRHSAENNVYYLLLRGHSVSRGPEH